MSEVNRIILIVLLDPVLTAIVEELFETIAMLSPEVVGSLVHHVTPRLASAILAPVTDATIHLPGEAVQLANSLLRSRGGPIEVELVAVVTAATMVCLRKTDDMDVIQVSDDSKWVQADRDSTG